MPEAACSGTCVFCRDHRKCLPLGAVCRQRQIIKGPAAGLMMGTDWAQMFCWNFCLMMRLFKSCSFWFLKSELRDAETKHDRSSLSPLCLSRSPGGVRTAPFCGRGGGRPYDQTGLLAGGESGQWRTGLSTSNPRWSTGMHLRFTLWVVLLIAEGGFVLMFYLSYRILGTKACFKIKIKSHITNISFKIFKVYVAFS